MTPLAARIGRFVRFGAVGAASALGSIAMLWALTGFAHWHYLPAYAATFVAMNALGYLGTRRYAFEATRVTHRAGIARYFLVAAASLAVNSLLMKGLVDGGDVNPLVASGLLSLLNWPLNYLLQGRLTFRIHRAR